MNYYIENPKHYFWYIIYPEISFIRYMNVIGKFVNVMPYKNYHPMVVEKYNKLLENL